MGEELSGGGQRVALVTGGGRGIGRAVALALADDGVDLLLGARTLAEVEAVAREVRARGRRAVAIPLDVTSEASVAAAFAACERELGPPGIVVNNAGIAPSARLIDTSLATWQETLAVNLTGPFLVSRAALPAMLAAGTGRIVNVASTAGKTGYAYTTAYTASKHGLVGLTRALAIELVGKGITVNAVCPGFVRTQMTEVATRNIVEKTGRTAAEAEAELAWMSPMKRLVEPDEVARIVVFLARPESAGITGQAWNVDGGAVMA